MRWDGRAVCSPGHWGLETKVKLKPFIDRAREMARGEEREERVGTVVTSLLERFRRGGATAASPVATSESASPRVEASRPVAAPAAPAAGAGSVQQSLLDKFRRSAS